VNPVRVVILGGGYVAVWSYRSLMRRLGPSVRRGLVEVTVVSPENAHAYHGWTGEVLGGIVSLPHRQSALRPLLAHARLVRGEAVRVSLEHRTVSVNLSGNGGRVELPYDHLVFGTGSRERMESVPALRCMGGR
jgi:NADH:ubiquinone reductase (H+-translocating)